MAIQVHADAQRLAQFCRTVRQRLTVAPTTVANRRRHAFHHLCGAHQGAGAETIRASGHVHAMVYAMAHIDVSVARRPEHRAVALTEPMVCVARRVGLVVCFRLHDARDNARAIVEITHDQAAEQADGHAVGLLGAIAKIVSLRIIRLQAVGMQTASLRPSSLQTARLQTARLRTVSHSQCLPREKPRPPLPRPP